MKSFLRKIQDERGISAVIVAVSVLGLFGASVLAIDAGSAWATRRKIVTGTDAAALAAARYFASSASQACVMGDGTWNGNQIPNGETEASTVLHANSAAAEHDPATGFWLTVSGCSTGRPVGHVRVDAKLGSKQAFSGIFGFGQTKPFSSSTAEFGYNLAPVGLRPIAICDQSSVTTAQWSAAGQPVLSPALPPGNQAAGVYPHYQLWNWLQKGTYADGSALPPPGFDQTAYERYWGSSVTDYPSVSLVNAQSINNGKPYLLPKTRGGTGGVVHRINSRDNCGGGASFRGWVDLNGGENGVGSSNCKDPQSLECMLLNGYDGSEGPVSIADSSATPPITTQCNNTPSQWCEEDGGNHNGIKDALNPITCPAAEASDDCIADGLYFPVILDNGVFVVSGQDEVHQVGFVFVILRGWGATDGDTNPCSGQNHSCNFDVEFVKVQSSGTVGRSPSNDQAPPTTDLCGIDHDTQTNRCNV